MSVLSLWDEEAVNTAYYDMFGYDMESTSLWLVCDCTDADDLEDLHEAGDISLGERDAALSVLEG